MSSRYLKNNDQVILNALPRFDISKGNYLKVALLIAGRSETSAYLVQELKKIDHINLLVIRTKQVTGESLKARYSRYKLYYSTLVRSIWSTGDHVRPIDTRTKSGSEHFIELLHPNLLTVLAKFKPDILAISGTKKVPDSVLSCATLALNLHHGSLPHYRGGSSIDWTTLENNYNHYGATVHIATSAIDGGPIVTTSRVTPFLFESFFMFRRRLYLTGAALLADTIKHIDRYTSIALKDPKPARIFRHTQKSNDHLDRVTKSFKALDLRRYIFLQRYRHVIRNTNSISFPKRMVASYITRSIRRQSLANGLYILNYHAICTTESVTILEQLKAPSIFTTEDNFLTHLSYLKDHFRCVPLSAGLQLWRQGVAEKEPIVALTFDDGLASPTKYLNQMVDVGLVPTYFVCGDPICNRTPLEVHKLLLAALYLDSSNINHTECFTKHFFSVFKSIDSSSDVISTFLERQYLTIEQARELLDRGLIEALGSHTETHRSLEDLDVASQIQEINNNHSKLVSIFGDDLKYFSFPFGKIDKHGLVSDYLTEGLGTDCFTCNGGINKTPDIPGSILRIAVSNQNDSQLDSYLKLQWVR